MPAGCIYVGRPTKWGNPFQAFRRSTIPAAELGIDQVSAVPITPGGVEECVALYRVWLFSYLRLLRQPWGANVADPLAELRGWDLACWCPLDRPCHADVLLELANR